jgi:putative tryptophan/tyrosine transport system substrate-binding protein
MRRRQFITLLGGAAWPLAARAQQPTMPVIGLLVLGTPGAYSFSGFRRGLTEEGYQEGQNLAIEYRFANDDPHRLAQLAGDMVRARVRVIVALASALSIQAAKAATETIPIVFGYGGDPVQQGFVASLNRPGGNLTGMTSLSNELVGKRLEILHELLPSADHFGLISNPKNLLHDLVVKDMQAAASAIGGTVAVSTASTIGEVDAAFARLHEEKRVQGLVISADPFFFARRVQIAILSAHHAVPVIYPFREQVEAGGLLSYGPDLAERDRQVGHYVGRVLKGEKPVDLPVLQPSKFELIINLSTAKVLGLTISNAMQLRADEVIE